MSEDSGEMCYSEGYDENLDKNNESNYDGYRETSNDDDIEEDIYNHDNQDNLNSNNQVMHHKNEKEHNNIKGEDSSSFNEKCEKNENDMGQKSDIGTVYEENYNKSQNGFAKMEIKNHLENDIDSIVQSTNSSGNHQRKKKSINSDLKPELNVIPPNLIPLIYHSTSSPVYLALQGQTIPNLNMSLQTSIINDLRKYLDMAVDRNLLNEACYVQNVIDKIRIDNNSIKAKTEKEINKIDQKIKEISMEIEERICFWDNEQTSLNRDHELALEQLELHKEQAIRELDREWQSPKKRQMYNKPSSTLLNLREMAKKMIKAKKFEEVNKIGLMISEREKKEIADASDRMNSDYKIADQRIQDRFETEKKVLIGIYETKTNNLLRARERNIQPIKQRLENLLKSKESVQKGKKSEITQSHPNSRSPSSITNISISTTLPQLISSPKLALPNVNPIKRDIKNTAKSSKLNSDDIRRRKPKQNE